MRYIGRPTIQEHQIVNAFHHRNARAQHYKKFIRRTARMFFSQFARNLQKIHSPLARERFSIYDTAEGMESI